MTRAIEEAKALDMDEAVELLKMTLEEEIATDEKLETAFQENLKLALEEEEEEKTKEQ